MREFVTKLVGPEEMALWLELQRNVGTPSERKKRAKEAKRMFYSWGRAIRYWAGLAGYYELTTVDPAVNQRIEIALKAVLRTEAKPNKKESAPAVGRTTFGNLRQVEAAAQYRQRFGVEMPWVAA